VLEKEVRCGSAIARTQRLWNVFVKRPALAPMYNALGLTSLDQVISNQTGSCARLGT
jgi:hypothetical protein